MKEEKYIEDLREIRELMTRSSKFISLQNLVVSNSDRGESKIISERYVIVPGKYLCLTEDIDYLRKKYCICPNMRSCQEI